jgi:urocanate hydratase
MIAVIAEVDEKALDKRFKQGWIQEKETDLEKVISKIKSCKGKNVSLSIGWLGNVVTLWERLAKEEDCLADLGSDQTSLHNPYNGGYYPVGLSFEESKKMMCDNPTQFKIEVQKSLVRHVNAINGLTSRGMKFWDYGVFFSFFN